MHDKTGDYHEIHQIYDRKQWIWLYIYILVFSFSPRLHLEDELTKQTNKINFNWFCYCCCFETWPVLSDTTVYHKPISALRHISIECKFNCCFQRFVQHLLVLELNTRCGLMCMYFNFRYYQYFGSIKMLFSSFLFFKYLSHAQSHFIRIRYEFFFIISYIFFLVSFQNYIFNAPVLFCARTLIFSRSYFFTFVLFWLLFFLVCVCVCYTFKELKNHY